MFKTYFWAPLNFHFFGWVGMCQILYDLLPYDMTHFIFFSQSTHGINFDCFMGLHKWFLEVWFREPCFYLHHSGGDTSQRLVPRGLRGLESDQGSKQTSWNSGRVPWGIEEGLREPLYEIANHLWSCWPRACSKTTQGDLQDIFVTMVMPNMTRGSGIPWTSVGFVRHLRGDG